MGFKTKLNLSENRLFKQFINKWTKFIGLHEFSVPLDERRLGADTENAVRTIIGREIYTNFEYYKDNDTIAYDFKIPEMSKSVDNIPTMTFDNELENVFVEAVFYGEEEYEIEGVIFYNKYTGYEYDLILDTLEITDFGYRGTFRTTELVYVETPSLDYKGDNNVLIVHGNILADKVISNSIYNIIEITGDFEINDVPKSNVIYVGAGKVSIDNDLPIGTALNFIFTNETTIETNGLQIMNPLPVYFGYLKLIKVNDNSYWIMGN